MLHKLTDNLLGLLFPDRCAGCGTVGTLFCPTCHTALRTNTAYPHASTLIEAQIAVYIFEGTLREAIHHFKYKPMRRMADPLGALLATYATAHPIPADAVVPVPLHPHRLRERGFNQSELLAQPVAGAYSLPLLATGLARRRDTAHQMKLDAKTRQENVRGAFVWQHPTPPPPRVLLIDDVLTTGATVRACAEALRAAGTREVRVLALATSHAG